MTDKEQHTITEYDHLSACFVLLSDCITLTSAHTKQMCWAGTCHRGALANMCRPARYKDPSIRAPFLINDTVM